MFGYCSCRIGKTCSSSDLECVVIVDVPFLEIRKQPKVTQHGCLLEMQQLWPKIQSAAPLWAKPARWLEMRRGKRDSGRVTQIQGSRYVNTSSVQQWCAEEHLQTNNSCRLRMDQQPPGDQCWLPARARSAGRARIKALKGRAENRRPNRNEYCSDDSRACVQSSTWIPLHGATFELSKYQHLQGRAVQFNECCHADMKKWTQAALWLCCCVFMLVWSSGQSKLHQQPWHVVRRIKLRSQVTSKHDCHLVFLTLKRLLLLQLAVSVCKMKFPIAWSRPQQTLPTKSVKACKNTGAVWWLSFIIKDAGVEKRKQRIHLSGR